MFLRYSSPPNPAPSPPPILEFLARHEEPANEEILKGFLRSGGERDVKDSEGFTALQWAVCRSQAVVGGYSCDEINSALKLIVKNTDKQSEAIKKLLQASLPTLDHVPNPNKKHIYKFQKSANSNPVMDYRGSIVDVLPGAGSKGIEYATSSVQKLIYDTGPEYIMREAGDLGERNLALLKKNLKKDYVASSNRIGVQTKDSPSLDSTSPQHEKIGDEEPSSGNLREFYLPVDEDLVSRLSSDSGRSEREHMAIMKHFDKSWTELAAGAERYHMKPQFVRKQGASHYHPINDIDGDQVPRESTAGACAALYMLYPDIGTFHRKGDKSSTTKSSAVLEGSINERNSREIKHEPITLDQYYYPTIDDTSKRDNDQVLSKFLEKKSKQSGACDSADPVSETIITATAQNFGETSKQISKADREPPESFLQNALDNILHGETKSQFERARTVDSLMELLLGVAPGLFIKRFAEKEFSLFQEFLQGLQEASPREPEQKQGQRSNAKSDSKSPDGPMPLNRYHVISSETELLNMIRDIRDELHMLRSLAEDQEIVWKQAFASSDLMHFKAYTPTNVKKDLDDMLSEADKTENYINTLLDLRQAEFGRLQAYDSARQSNSIFISTLMTIVFWTTCNIRRGGYFLLSAVGVTALVSVPATIFAWKINAISNFRPRNNITGDSSTHTDAIKGVLTSVRRRGRKQHDLEAK
ncbi:hypothetical protein BPAE_0227g00100 [Botrytis paeoniae]|uniref:Ankyrin repeat protein n=1 Tax=Botrytis paeoniae TaxID=278948 RepID=A0A4Z1FDD6_9HELO|nr:hypothetical protein BPAE_0227g00100 [Botrytis paeoniae]